MTPGQAIMAGGLAAMRNAIRRIRIHEDRVSLVVHKGSAQEIIQLNKPERAELVEALDLHLSNRLLKLGVREYEEDETPTRPAADIVRLPTGGVVMRGERYKPTKPTK